VILGNFIDDELFSSCWIIYVRRINLKIKNWYEKYNIYKKATLLLQLSSLNDKIE